MEHTLERLPKSRAKITVKLSNEEFKKHYESAYQRLAAHVEIKGFRRGKAPRNLAEAHIGSDKIFSDALDRALPQCYAQAVEKEKLIPIERPKVDIKEIDPKKPLVFVMEVDVLPEINLPDYKNVKIKKDKISVSKKEIENAYENIKRSYATFKPRKNGAQKGDKVEIDFQGSLKGVKIDSLVSKNHPIVLGETKLIPGFTEKLMGAKKGDKLKFDLPMPKDTRDKLVAGKKVSFEIEIKSVEEIIYPEIEEKFVKKISKFKTVKEFDKSLEKSLLGQKEIEQEKDLQEKIVKKLAEKTKIEIPESLIQSELARMIEDLSARIQMQGGTLDQWLASIKKTKDDFEKELKNQAEESVKINLIVSKIRGEEKIQASDKEIENEIKMLELQGQKVPSDEETKRYIGNILGNRKVLKQLVEIATK